MAETESVVSSAATYNNSVNINDDDAGSKSVSMLSKNSRAVSPVSFASVNLATRKRIA